MTFQENEEAFGLDIFSCTIERIDKKIKGAESIGQNCVME